MCVCVCVCVCVCACVCVCVCVFHLHTYICLSQPTVLRCMFYHIVRDRQRTKMERDILVLVAHPFIVNLHYGECRINIRTYVRMYVRM